MIGVAQGRIDCRLVQAERPSDDELLCEMTDALAIRHGCSIVDVVLRRYALDGLKVVRNRVNDAPVPFICDLGGRKGDQIGPAVVFLCCIFNRCSKLFWTRTTLTRAWNNPVRRSGMDMVAIDNV